MQAIVLTVLALASFALAGDVEFTTCASQNQATIRRFAVSDCPTGSTSCTFIKGQTYTFEIEGHSHANSPVANNLHYEVTGTWLGIPFTLLEGDACEDNDLCPIAPGANILWGVGKTISDSTPAISNVLVTARIWPNQKGTNANAAACAQFTVTIRNAKELKRLVASLTRNN